MASFRLKSLEARSFLLFPGIAGAADATPNKVYFDATLTIFTGPSGGGKTSVLRAIHAVLLHHYCDANDPRLPDPEDLVNVQGEGNNFTVPRSEATLIFEDHSGHEHGIKTRHPPPLSLSPLFHLCFCESRRLQW